MNRRSPGEGSIQRDGDRWKAILTREDPLTGQVTRRIRRTKSKSEAIRALRAFKSELESTGILSNGRITVAEACDRFLEVKEGEDLTKGTLRSHTWMISIIRDVLGTRKLSDLTVPECDQFLRISAKGVGNRKPIGPDHLNRLRSELRAVITNAEREGLVARNVAQLSVLPKSDSSEPRKRYVLTPAQLTQLLAGSTGTSVGCLVVLSGIAALRPAESRALTWKDIDLNDAVLTVIKQLDEASNTTDPKSKNASRRIAVPNEVVTELRKWRKVQTEQRLRAGAAWQHDDRIITTRFGTAINKDNMKRALKSRAFKAAVPPLRPYDLRHTAITNLANDGYTNWQLADYAGTSVRMIEETYRHRTEGIVRLTLNQVSDSGKHHLRHQ